MFVHETWWCSKVFSLNMVMFQSFSLNIVMFQSFLYVCQRVNGTCHGQSSAYDPIVYREHQGTSEAQVSSDPYRFSQICWTNESKFVLQRYTASIFLVNTFKWPAGMIEWHATGLFVWSIHLGTSVSKSEQTNHDQMTGSPETLHESRWFVASIPLKHIVPLEQSSKIKMVK